MRPIPEADICPGYTIQLPEVMEAARAFAWRESGSLSSVYSGRLPPYAIDCIDILSGAVRGAEREAIRNVTERD